MDDLDTIQVERERQALEKLPAAAIIARQYAVVLIHDMGNASAPQDHEVLAKIDGREAELNAERQELESRAQVTLRPQRKFVASRSR